MLAITNDPKAWNNWNTLSITKAIKEFKRSGFDNVIKSCIRRVDIPKPGTRDLRPLNVPPLNLRLYAIVITLILDQIIALKLGALCNQFARKEWSAVNAWHSI